MSRWFWTSVLPFGRAPRWQYFVICLLWVAATLALQLPYAALLTGDPRLEQFLSFVSRNWVVLLGSGIMLGYVTLMTMINRYHDQDRSGWGLSWFAVPYLFYLAAVMIRSPQSMAYLGIDADTGKFVGGSIVILGYLGATVISLVITVRCLFVPGDRFGNAYGPSPGDK